MHWLIGRLACWLGCWLARQQQDVGDAKAKPINEWKVFDNNKEAMMGDKVNFKVAPLQTNCVWFEDGKAYIRHEQRLYLKDAQGVVIEISVSKRRILDWRITGDDIVSILCLNEDVPYYVARRQPESVVPVWIDYTRKDESNNDISDMLAILQNKGIVRFGDLVVEDYDPREQKRKEDELIEAEKAKRREMWRKQGCRFRGNKAYWWLEESNKKEVQDETVEV